MPITIDGRSTLTRLAWFVALWLGGVVSVACVAGVLRLVLSSRLLGLAR